MKHILIFTILIMICSYSYADEIQDVSDELVRGKSFEETITILMNDVHEKMIPSAIPLEEARKMNDWDKYKKGVGWCNHQVNVWMAMCQRQGIKTRMLYLLSKDMSVSTHTIGEAWDGKKWVVADVSNNIIFRKRNGDLMSRKDMFNDWELCLEKLMPLNDDEEYWEMFIRNCYKVKVLEP